MAEYIYIFYTSRICYKAKIYNSTRDQKLLIYLMLVFRIFLYYMFKIKGFL